MFSWMFVLYVDSYHTLVDRECREGQPMTMDFRNTAGG